MGFFTDLLGGPGKTREFGGGFDPAIKEQVEEGFGVLTEQFRAGPRVYQGERVAGFTDPQLAAQTSLLALSTAQPDYYKTALGGLEEAFGLQREATKSVTAEDVAAQRKILEPMGAAQREVQRQAFESALRDIGVGAGGAGVGALTGARADILRGGAAGELAVGLAGIEGQLQQQALQQAEADRARQAAGASALAQLTGQRLGIGQEGFGEQLQRIGLGAGVGAEQRQFEQQKIAAEMDKFREDDPFKFAQQYLQTIYAAPTRQTQYSQDPSTFQEAVGIGTTIAGFMNEGGTVHKDMGGALAQMLMSKRGNKVTMADVDKNMDTFAPTILNEGGGILSKIKSMYNKARGGTDTFSAEEEAEIRDIEDFSDKNFGTDYASERDSTKSRVSPSSAMASVGSKTITPDDSVMFAKQRAARQAMAMRQNGGGIASLQVGGVPVGKPGFNRRRVEGSSQENSDGESNAFQRILSGVGSGLRSIGSGIRTGAKYYADNLDPFGPAGANLTREERIRVGLGILAAQPTLGESPLTTTARGALAAFGELPEDDTITLRTSPVPSSEYEDIDKGVIGLQGVESKADADVRVGLRRDAETEALNKVKAGTVSNDPASYRTEVLRIYKKKVEDKFGKKAPAGGAGQTGGAGSAVTQPQSKGSTSSKIKQITGKQPTNP
jgi:hypothetical protein